MKLYLDLFSGIGGFALAAYWAGLRFSKHCFSEIDPYAVELYKKRFPETEHLGDIKNVDYSKLPKGAWFVTGGFPCQPHSVAGQRQGSADERDLWPECRRTLRELRPKVALFENVPGLFVSNGGRFFNRVLSDISESGYACEWQVISALEAGAPHLRKRVWIIAYRLDEQAKQQICKRPDTFFGGVCGNVAYTEGKLRERSRQARTRRSRPSNGNWWETEPDVGRVAHGVSARVDRLKCLGNAIVPQCAKLIFALPVFDEWRKNDLNP